METQKRDIKLFIPDLYDWAIGGAQNSFSIIKGKYNGFVLSDDVTVIKIAEKEGRYKLCVWGNNKDGLLKYPHLLISTDPYSEAEEIAGEPINFAPHKYDLIVRFFSQEKTSGPLEFFITNLIKRAREVFDLYDKGGTAVQIEPAHKRNPMALSSFGPSTFKIAEEWKDSM